MLSSYHLTEERLPNTSKRSNGSNRTSSTPTPPPRSSSPSFWNVPVNRGACRCAACSPVPNAHAAAKTPARTRLRLPRLPLVRPQRTRRARRRRTQSELFYFWPTYGFVEFGDADRRRLPRSHRHELPQPRHAAGPLPHRRLRPARRSAHATAISSSPGPPSAEIAGREQEFLVSRTGRRISLTAFNMHDAIFDGCMPSSSSRRNPVEAEFRYVPGPPPFTPRASRPSGPASPGSWATTSPSCSARCAKRRRLQPRQASLAGVSKRDPQHPGARPPATA
jgi:hypothetical protein